MKSFTFTLLKLLATATVVLADLNVYHRIIGGPELSDFTPRGTISFSDEGEATYTPSATFHSDLSSFFANKDIGQDALYQVALERPHDKTSDNWDLSSTKACYLSSKTSDIITLVLSSDGIPFGLNYHLLNAPRDGSCPPSTAVSPSIVDTSVALKTPYTVPTPILRTPPPLAPDGKPIVPPPEKSFIQKYWIYSIPIIILLLLAPEDESALQGAAAKK